MENPFRGIFESDDAKKQRLATEIYQEVEKLDGYPNMECFAGLAELGQIGEGYGTDELVELANLISGTNPNDMEVVLNQWLVDHEKIVPMIAGMRNRWGLSQAKDGKMSYPKEMDHPENDHDLSEKEDNENARLAEEDYRTRMQLPLEVFGPSFVKQKFDNLYADTAGGPGFESAIEDLMESLSELDEVERAERLEDFVSKLR